MFESPRAAAGVATLLALLASSQIVPRAALADEAADGSGSSCFSFGSYGRVMAGGDLEGGLGEPVSVTANGPRLIEDPYLELDLRYALTASSGAAFDTLVTIALTDAFFHLDGDFDGAIAIRNAYVRASGFGVEGLSVWTGSRMLRGDDIYLLDFWPLDDLNTVGGGAAWDSGLGTTVSAHGGVNQLGNRYQRQEVAVPAPDFGTESLQLLDRVRALASLRVEHVFADLGGGLGAKIVAYGDYQAVGPGTFENDDDVRIDLPAARGWTGGAQVGLWGFAPNAFANVFFRASGGLAAYDELGVPVGVGLDLGVDAARLFRVGVSANAESRWVGVTGAGYAQWFRDADDLPVDPDDYSEVVVAVRPVIFASEHFHQAFEVSYQRRFPDGLNRRTDTYLEPAMWQFGVMPTLTAGRGVYSRPQLRLLYAVSLLNDGALAQWPEGDARASRDIQHYLGVGAEWWFNSSSYQ